MPDGTYQIRVGLYSGAQRAVLYGNNDGNLRYTVGSITVANNGSSISYTAIPISIPIPTHALIAPGRWWILARFAQTAWSCSSRIRTLCK